MPSSGHGLYKGQKPIFRSWNMIKTGSIYCSEVRYSDPACNWDPSQTIWTEIFLYSCYSLLWWLLLKTEQFSLSVLKFSWLHFTLSCAQLWSDPKLSLFTKLQICYKAASIPQSKTWFSWNKLLLWAANGEIQNKYFLGMCFCTLMPAFKCFCLL